MSGANLNPNNAPPRTDEFEQYILNLSFDHYHKLLMMGLLGYNPNQLGPDGVTPGRYDRIQINDLGGFLTSSPNAAARYDVSGTTIYIGESVPGTAEGTSAWTITKVDLSSNPYSEKIATNASWTGRAGATYS